MQLQSTINDDLAGNLNNSKINSRLYQSECIYEGINTFTTLETMFEELQGPCIYDFFNDDELALIKKIIRDPKDRAFKKKFPKLDAIIKPKGFKRSGCGTNRVVYEPLDDNATFCIKVALDKAGAKNNPDEIVNQKYLKPFVAKCFDISQDGNVGIFERVVPIENLNQMWSVRDDIYKIMEAIVGRFIVDDFGTKAFKNWGVRKGFGPVLLDYADMYILDPNVLYCDNTVTFESHELCRGELDYDAGFNNIICLKCGSIHMASEYKNGRKKIAIFSRRREVDMTAIKVEIFKGDKLYWDNTNGFYKTEEESPVYNTPDPVVQNQLEELDAAKEDLARAEAELIKTEQKVHEIVIPAKNPAKPRFNKLYAPKPDRPKRDLDNTMHAKALDKITEPLEKVQDLKVEEPKVVEFDQFGNDNKVENHKSENNVLNIKEEETEELKRLIHEEIIPLGKYIRTIADDIEAIADTDDAYSYNEILEFDKAFKKILSMNNDDTVLTLTKTFPPAFLDGNITDDVTVNAKVLHRSIGEDIAYASNKIFDVLINIESKFEDNDEEQQVRTRAPRRRAKIGLEKY